jgi:Rit1 N-terminal domain
MTDRHVERALNRDVHTLHNCLLSILDDARFVSEIRSLYRVPMLANLRCGLWYQPSFDGFVYFKSTDGHYGKWSFSTTRLNLSVIKVCCEHGGCVIVDATRRGKSFPVCTLSARQCTVCTIVNARQSDGFVLSTTCVSTGCFGQDHSNLGRSHKSSCCPS